MKISLEISMYALTADYKVHVRSFIEDLGSFPEIEVRVNGMSTQVFGEFDAVMHAFTSTMKNALSKGAPISFVTKTLGSDVSGYSFVEK